MARNELLPLHVLRQKVCTRCLQYLTVLPIVIDTNGDTICGRHETSGTNSILNKVMENYGFNCTNHFEGCQELLDDTTSRQHETECNYEAKVCFFCLFSGNWSQILQHYKLKHPFNYIEDGGIQFKLQKNMSQTFIYCIRDCFYKVAISIKSNDLWLSVANVSQNFPVEKILIHFIFEESTVDDYMILSENFEGTVIKNLDELKVGFSYNCEIYLDQVEVTTNEIELSKRLITVCKNHFSKPKDKMIPALYISQLCESCENGFERDMFICLNNHLCCNKCVVNCCSTCSTTKYKRIDDLEKIMKKCDWYGCGIETSLAKFKNHSRNCSKRPYKCPDLDCIDKSFTRIGLLKHWHIQHEIVNNNAIDVDFHDVTKNDISIFWLYDTQLYHVIASMSNQVLKVIVEEVNVVFGNKIKIDQYQRNPAKYVKVCEATYVNGRYECIMQNATWQRTRIYIVDY